MHTASTSCFSSSASTQKMGIGTGVRVVDKSSLPPPSAVDGPKRPSPKGGGGGGKAEEKQQQPPPHDFLQEEIKRLDQVASQAIEARDANQAEAQALWMALEEKEEKLKRVIIELENAR